MKSVYKGDAFEKQVFEHFEEELKNDRLHVTPKSSKIFSKKRYFSRDRNSDIVVDISIETWMPQAVNYSLLTVIECKNYSKPIPVDDVEEFHSKVTQISGDNVKAIFVTNSSLQKGALEFAKSKKIAVVRFLPEDQVRWIFHFEGNSHETKLSSREFHTAILSQNYVSERGHFYAMDDKFIYGTLFSMLKSYLNE